MQDYEKKLNGYFTVEASFIIPMTLAVFAFIIQISFHMYGRTVLYQDTYMFALNASLVSEKSEREDYVYSNSAIWAGNKYFGNIPPEFSVAQDNNWISVIASSETRHDAAKGVGLPQMPDWGMGASAKAKAIDRPGKIRTVERIKDISLSIVEKNTEKNKNEY